jgi:hypothetical protein
MQILVAHILYIVLLFYILDIPKHQNCTFSYKEENNLSTS